MAEIPTSEVHTPKTRSSSLQPQPMTWAKCLFQSPYHLSTTTLAIVENLTPKLSSSSVNSLDNFTDDLLFQVFLRLPNSKSAFQYRCVSKRWCSILSDPVFIGFFVHRQRLLAANSNYSMPFTIFITCYNSLPTGEFLLNSNLSSRKYPMFSHIIHQGRPPLFTSSNYLNFPSLQVKKTPVTWCSSNDLSLISYPGSKNFYVFNPVTMKDLALAIPDANIHDTLLKLGLACKMNEQDNYSYNYKVVFISSFGWKPESDKFIATIYCSKTRKWFRYLVSSPKRVYLRQYILIKDVVAVCNGMLYWIEGKRYCQGIVAFDPFERPKRFLYIYKPDEIRNSVVSRTEVCIGECQGRLRMSYLTLVPRTDLFVLLVWELRNYDNNDDSWSLKHRINLRRRERILDSPADLNVVGFHPNNGDIIFLMNVEGIFEFDLQKRKEEKICQVPADQSSNHLASLLVHPPWPTQP